MVTLKDIAERVRKSVTTVSRALAGYSDVSPSTIQLVRETAAEMGYVPNSLAQRLRKRSTDTLGIVLPSSSEGYAEPFYSEFLAGIGKAASLNGYDLLVAYAHDNDELAIYRKLITGRRVDGFILNRMQRNDPRVELLTQAGFPFSAFGRIENSETYPYIEEDGNYAMGLIVQHLLQRGHRRIACIGPPEQVMFSHVRLESVASHLRASGFSLDPALVRIGFFNQQDGYEQTRSLLRLPDPPTAVIGFNDLIAFGAINAGIEQGLIIGKDLAVTGFDDIPMAAHYRPPLTTIRQPIQRIGSMVVELLIDHLHASHMQDLTEPDRAEHRNEAVSGIAGTIPPEWKEKAAEHNRQLLLRPELIIREST